MTYECDHCEDMRTAENECGAEQPENDKGTHYVCTKNKGHNGDHVACGGGPFEACHNFAVWATQYTYTELEREHPFSTNHIYFELLFDEDINQQDDEPLDTVNAQLRQDYGDQIEIDWRDDRTCWVTPTK